MLLLTILCVAFWSHGLHATSSSTRVRQGFELLCPGSLELYQQPHLLFISSFAQVHIGHNTTKKSRSSGNC
jgi:hypothetical protein